MPSALDTTAPAPRAALRIGPLCPAAPVVLAPMAGVTNAPFRALCRRFGPGLIYVNEMVMATALVHANAKTERMARFGAGETPRSLQLYASNPEMVAQAIHRLGEHDRVDHVDLNLGCPAGKVTRRGGGAAIPARPKVLRALLRAAVGAARTYRIPVTAKFRLGLFDHLHTHLATGQIAAEEGVAAVALHARTAEQHYAGEAQWSAIAELKAAVGELPVLGNGDIWEATDALAMVAQTNCDGVVIGRGCLGRPWLFGQLLDAFAGRAIRPTPTLGEVCSMMADHARLAVDHFGADLALRDFRKHTGWYLTGYPVGGPMRARLAMVATLGQLDDLLGEVLDASGPQTTMIPGGERTKRGHTNGPIRVALPDGYLDDLDAATPPTDGDVLGLSGG